MDLDLREQFCDVCGKEVDSLEQCPCCGDYLCDDCMCDGFCDRFCDGDDDQEDDAFD